MQPGVTITKAEEQTPVINFMVISHGSLTNSWVKPLRFTGSQIVSKPTPKSILLSKPFVSQPMERLLTI